MQRSLEDLIRTSTICISISKVADETRVNPAEIHASAGYGLFRNKE